MTFRDLKAILASMPDVELDRPVLHHNQQTGEFYEVLFEQGSDWAEPAPEGKCFVADNDKPSF